MKWGSNQRLFRLVNALRLHRRFDVFSAREACYSSDAQSPYGTISKIPRYQTTWTILVEESLAEHMQAICRHFQSEIAKDLVYQCEPALMKLTPRRKNGWLSPGSSTRAAWASNLRTAWPKTGANIVIFQILVRRDPGEWPRRGEAHIGSTQT